MIVIEGALIAESLRVGTHLEDLTLTIRKISRLQPQDTTADQPAWYVDFRSPAETFVVFPGRIFRYPRGDAAGRAEAEGYGRQLAIPGTQLDWPV
jgi:hypothetical protein